MRRLIVAGGITVAVIAVAGVALRLYTKSFSPSDTSQYERDSLMIAVNYCRPYKKDRQIFGELVPYGEVWRTGANEATIFTVNEPIKIKDQLLQPGKYSLFTVPGEDSWQIIWNSETGQWGVKIPSGAANRSEEKDVVEVEVPSIKTNDLFEQFTISFTEMSGEIEMVFMWENTLVVVPMYRTN